MLVLLASVFAILMSLPALLDAAKTYPKFLPAFCGAFLFLIRTVYEGDMGKKLGSRILWVLGFLLILLTAILQILG